jgi:hypothetical protein
VSLPSNTRHGKQGEAFRSVLSLLFRSQACGQTNIDFEVAGDVMGANTVFLKRGLQPIRGGPAEQIEMQLIGGMEPTGR